jgi:eukaryotic-like serine/threonine-protein kinase
MAREPRAARSGARPGDAATDPLLGRILDGRYLLTSRIARGGMAGVYEAHDRRLDRIVAVKVMHPGMGDDRAYAARFVREARAAARLDHPNVVQIFDQGEDDGTLFLVMELVRGTTLRDQMAPHSPMQPARALAVMVPVLSALSAAHRAGLMHRDVKPENVLIADDSDHGTGRIKVADFGLARAVTSETQHTSTGVLIGTVSYIAPEIVSNGRADQRSDVYSAGVMLYELLTGRKPHEGESPIQVAYKHVHEDVPAPSLVVPEIPAYVDALVARATSRDPDLRPADAAVMLRQAQRVAQALAAGVADDDELTADLALPARPVAEHTIVDHLGSDDLHSTAVRRRTAEVSRPVPVPAPVKERRRRGPLLVLVSVLLVAAVGASAWWFGFGRYTTAPGVLGLSQAAATAKLEQAGLTVSVTDPDWSETTKAGLVMRADPSGGNRVLNGGTVTLTLSKGPEIYRLPDLAGKSLDEARSALDQLKMSFGKAVSKWSETVPADQVIKTDPGAGTELRPGSSVDVWVSKGRQPITVTSWVGKDGTTAEKTLAKAGLTVKTTASYSDTVAKGKVISQSPSSGTRYKGDTVTLEISKGPELIEVPGGLKASGVDAARKKLEALGFKVVTRKSALYLGLGFVSSSDPGSGAKVPKGSTITLSLV